MKRLYLDETELDTWFERDRGYVVLSVSKTQEPLLEFWDEAVLEAVEDGFLDPKNFHASAYDYAVHLGIVQVP